MGAAIGDEAATVSAIETAVSEPYRHPDEIFEHHPLGRADAAIVFGKFGVGAGMGDEDWQRGGRFWLDAAADRPLLEQVGHTLEPLPGCLAADSIAPTVRQGPADAAEKTPPNGWLADAADFIPKHGGEIAKIVARSLVSSIGQPVRKPRPAPSGLVVGNLIAGNESAVDRPLEPLPNGGRRHAECRNQFPDFERSLAPQQFEEAAIDWLVSRPRKKSFGAAACESGRCSLCQSSL